MGDGKEDMATEAKSNSFTITLKTPKENVDFTVESKMLIKDVSVFDYWHMYVWYCQRFSYVAINLGYELGNLIGYTVTIFLDTCTVCILCFFRFSFAILLKLEKSDHKFLIPVYIMCSCQIM